MLPVASATQGRHRIAGWYRCIAGRDGDVPARLCKALWILASPVRQAVVAIHRRVGAFWRRYLPLTGWRAPDDHPVSYEHVHARTPPIFSAMPVQPASASVSP